MGYPVAYRAAAAVLSRQLPRAFRAAGFRLPPVRVPAPPPYLGPAVVAAVYFYSWAKIIYDAYHMQVPAPTNAAGWTVNANCGLRQIPINHFGVNLCNQQKINGGSLTLPGNPVAYKQVVGLYRSWIINWGRKHPFGPNWAYLTYNAQLTKPWADQSPVALPIPGQYVTVSEGKKSWVGPAIPRLPVIAGTVPALQALAGEAPQSSTHGNAPPIAAEPNTGAIDRNRLAWWALQEALTDAWWPGRAPALPVPVAPGVPIPGVVNPPIAPPVPGVRPFPSSGAVYPPLQISQAPAAQLPFRGPKKEYKLQSSTLAGLLRIASWSWNKADDYKDYINALYQALPDSCRGKHRSRGGVRRKPLAERSKRAAGQRGTRRLSHRRQTGSSVQTTGRDFNGPRMGNASVEQKIAAIGKCIDRMDPAKALQNLAREAMQDILGAGAAYARDKSAQRIRRNTRQPNFNTQFETRAPGL